MDVSYFEQDDTQPKDGPRPQATVATLGNSKTMITCSLDVANKIFPGKAPAGFESFEEAANMVKSGAAKLLLVPAAYPNARHFLMDEDLRLLKVKKMKIPEIVFGNMQDDLLAPVDTIYHHRAVESLVQKLPVLRRGMRLVPVSSNEVAYEKMAAHGERAGCISNKLVLDYHKRRSLIVLRTRRDMAWMVFCAAPQKKGPKS